MPGASVANSSFPLPSAESCAWRVEWGPNSNDNNSSMTIILIAEMKAIIVARVTSLTRSEGNADSDSADDIDHHPDCLQGII